MNTQNPDRDQPQQPSQSGQSSKFRTAAYDPTRTYDTVLGRPRQLEVLRKLTIVSFVLYLVSSVVGTIMAMDESLMRHSLEQTGAFTETQINDALEGAATIGLITSIVMAAVAVILYVVVIIGVSRAKNWGRIMGIVLAIIGGLFTLYGLVTSLGDFAVAPGLLTVSTVIIVAWLAVTIWWIIIAFNTHVRSYFASSASA